MVVNRLLVVVVGIDVIGAAIIVSVVVFEAIDSDGVINSDVSTFVGSIVNFEVDEFFD